MGNKRLREVERALIHAVMFEAGIVPMEEPRHDMRRALEQLPPDEARAMKRKFRKLWRRAMRDKLVGLKAPQVRFVKRVLGVGQQSPSRAVRTARKEMVFDAMWETTILPFLTRFHNPDDRTSETAH